jgi:hypothetical protein
VLGVPAVVAVVHEYRHAEAVYAGQTTVGHVFQLRLGKLHSVYSGLRVAKVHLNVVGEPHIWHMFKSLSKLANARCAFNVVQLREIIMHDPQTGQCHADAQGMCSWIAERYSHKR